MLLCGARSVAVGGKQVGNSKSATTIREGIKKILGAMSKELNGHTGDNAPMYALPDLPAQYKGDPCLTQEGGGRMVVGKHEVKIGSSRQFVISSRKSGTLGAEGE